MKLKPKKEKNDVTNSNQSMDYVMNILACDEMKFIWLETFLLSPILELRPHTTEHAIKLLAYFIEQAICDTRITILKTDDIMAGSYVIDDRRDYKKYAIVFEIYLDKNEVFSKLSDEHQCWLILNNLM